jgi:hypothetical protein
MRSEKSDIDAFGVILSELVAVCRHLRS